MAKLLKTWLGASLLVALLSATALAQEEVDSDVINQIGKLISWGGVLTSSFVIAGAWLLLRFIRSNVDSLGERFASQRLAIQKAATAVQFVIYVATGAVVIMLSFNLNDKVLALVGGTVAVSVGFAVKDVFASFIAGIMILVDRPFQVGDRVSFGGQYGDITSIGLRSVRLQTLDDNTVTIPNNKFLNEITSCGNYGALDMQVVVDFFIGLDQDVKIARQLVIEAAVTASYVHLPKPVEVLVTQVIRENYVAVQLKLKAYVLDMQYEKHFESDVSMRVMEAFQQNDVLPPAILHRTMPARPRSA